jgi:hypothetical protein
MRLTRIALIALLVITVVSTVACSSSQEVITYCSSWCENTWIGDGQCDSPCNNAACNYDGGDCAIQMPSSTYHINETFNMTLDDPFDGGLEIICDYDHSMLELVSYNEVRHQSLVTPSVPGFSIEDIWTFKAIKVGDTIITMNYVPFGQSDIYRSYIYPISIISDSNKD